MISKQIPFSALLKSFLLLMMREGLGMERFLKIMEKY